MVHVYAIAKVIATAASITKAIDDFVELFEDRSNDTRKTIGSGEY